jgi:hypothetical protein
MPDPQTVYEAWQNGTSFIRQAREGGWTLASVVMAAYSWSVTL